MDLGLILSTEEVDQIISGQGTPPGIVKALKEGATLRRVKRDSIYASVRFAAGVAAAGTQALAAGTYQIFSSQVGQSQQGFVPPLTLAQTNLRQGGKSPFSGIFVGRRLNVYIWSTTGTAPNNQISPGVDLLVNQTPLSIKKGTSFEWNVGPLKKAINFRGNKLYSVMTDAVGYGIGDGYDIGIPFIIANEESLTGEILVPNPAAHGLTLPASYVIDLMVEFDGDAVELVSQ